ncbi:MAG: hypothetical protein Q7T55_05080 [Solirubrobacteraceae bacterium]|nr:hypothetical protein [Solirubrobacteraceae bacterium]
MTTPATSPPLRPRTLLGAARSAPWQAAAPLMLVASAVLWVGLMVADAGGWGRVVPSGEVGYYVYAYEDLDGDTFFTGQPWDFLSVNGDTLIVVLSALLVGLALAGRRWPTVAVVAALAVSFAGWVADGQQLEYITLHLGRPDESTGTGLQTAITVYGVIGLLLAAAMLTALSWAIAGSLASRRARRTVDPRPAPSPRSPRDTARIVIGAVLLALAMPRLGLWLRDGMESLLGTAAPEFTDGPSFFDEFSSYGAHTLWLLTAAIVVVFVGALVMPRRAPAVAAALTVLSLALLIPAFWMYGPVIEEVLSISWLTENGAFAFWAPVIVIGLALAAWCFARTGLAATASVSSRNAPAQVARDPADHLP